MQYIGKGLLYISKNHRALLAKRLAEIDLFPGQDGLLYYLSLEDGQTMSALVEKMQIQHATLFNMVERMSKTGLLSKVKDATDKRTSVIYLTDRSKDKIKELGTIWRTVEAQMEKGITAAEKKLFLDVLGRINNNIIEKQ